MKWRLAFEVAGIAGSSSMYGRDCYAGEPRNNAAGRSLLGTQADARVQPVGPFCEQVSQDRF